MGTSLLRCGGCSPYSGTLNSSLFPSVLRLSPFFFFPIKANYFPSRLSMIINYKNFNHFHTLLDLKRILDHLNPNTSLRKDRKHRAEIFKTRWCCGLTCVSPTPQKRYLLLPTPRTHKCVFIWKPGCCRCNQDDIILDLGGL